MPTLIVPANSASNQPDANTGDSDDPLKDDTLISILLSPAFPWEFTVNSSDATAQLLNTFPDLIASALGINSSQVQTYGLMVYQPAAWNGNPADLLTQYLAYIPTNQFNTLDAYIKTQSSPLYQQPGIQGQLAAQINTAFPLAASSGPTDTSTSSASSPSGSRKRDIIIGVCVGIGGLLWVALVFWIYKRVKRSNDRAVHKRLSEHMSMFSGRPDTGYGAVGGVHHQDMDQRRHSAAPSFAASEIDDRPSSFYASPVDNERPMRQTQGRHLSVGGASYGGYSQDGQEHASPTTYGPSVFGTSWFANPHSNADGPSRPAQRMSQAQNPFEDIVTRSYLTTSGSSGSLNAANAPQRRSAAPRKVEVQKAMISQPTLQGSSLEYREF